MGGPQWAARLILKALAAYSDTSAAAAETAREQADQPDERNDRGDDEQPVHDKADTEQDDRQNRQRNQQQHSPPLLLPEMKGSFAGSGQKTRNGAGQLRAYPHAA